MPHAAKIIANGKNNHITLKVDYSGTNQVKHMADTTSYKFGMLFRICMMLSIV